MLAADDGKQGDSELPETKTTLNEQDPKPKHAQLANMEYAAHNLADGIIVRCLRPNRTIKTHEQLLILTVKPPKKEAMEHTVKCFFCFFENLWKAK